jgi:hypothetical protein
MDSLIESNASQMLACVQINWDHVNIQILFQKAQGRA